MASPPVASGIIPVPWGIVLHPYGRYCNANKFAGEIDTLECLTHTKKHYRIHDKSIVARGFSMGGAACWQFAVHYPCLWAAAAPGAGFAETPEFLDVFQKEKLKPAWYEEKLWRLYNATDYAANLANVTTVAYSGELDRQKQAAEVMARELKKEGIELTHVIGPKTGHTYHPDSKEEIHRRIESNVTSRFRDTVWPVSLRFTTFTLRYNQCHWLTIDRLERHWERARVDAEVMLTDFKLKTMNVVGLTISLPPGSYLPTYRVVPHVTIDEEKQEVGLPTTDGSVLVHFQKVDGKWKRVDSAHQAALEKRHGLQGPIDDAFMDSFVNVKPTGKPMNAKSGEWVEKEMAHAVDHWRKQFRGDAPVKNDTEITEDDIRNSNLVLWGDPSSNKLLAKIADKLPVKWGNKMVIDENRKWELQYVDLGGKAYPSDTHVPVLIYPNPLNPKKYVVLNSGFTFREYDQLNNARQVPKLPDYAVIDITTPPNSRFPGKVVRAGFFGEKWELLPDDGK
jgi:dienelactone hydrolase